MTKVSIIGGGGYTGGELIRSLLLHPEVTLSSIQSESQAGKSIAEAHPDLLPYAEHLFDHSWDDDAEVLFLCLGHGRAKTYLKEHPEAMNKMVIDLSHDFRIKSEEHDFVYGLPEAFKPHIRKTRHIANPGCFATAIQLALLPLAAHHRLPESVNIHAITGATGAGQALSDTTHFAWRDNNISVYKPFTHQHLGEINQTLYSFMPSPVRVMFIPVRGNFSKGIFCTTYMACNDRLEEILALYQSYYEAHPFVWITRTPVSLKPVLNTNHCFIQLEKHGDQLLITTVIDNLIKGAAGQAIQNMNLILGLDETCGLNFKASAF